MQHWTFHILAVSQPQVLPRLVQFFEQQRMVVRGLGLALLDRSARISITVEASDEAAHRLQDKLSHQADVREVEVELLSGPVPTASSKRRPSSHPA
jgi:acetolactate synthase regulatory subunit